MSLKGQRSNPNPNPRVRPYIIFAHCHLYISTPRSKSDRTTSQGYQVTTSAIKSYIHPAWVCMSIRLHISLLCYFCTSMNIRNWRRCYIIMSAKTYRAGGHFAVVYYSLINEQCTIHQTSLSSLISVDLSSSDIIISSPVAYRFWLNKCVWKESGK